MNCMEVSSAPKADVYIFSIESDPIGLWLGSKFAQSIRFCSVLSSCSTPNTLFSFNSIIYSKKNMSLFNVSSVYSNQLKNWIIFAAVTVNAYVMVQKL